MVIHTLFDMLAAVGQVDHLPAATLVAPLTRGSDTGHEETGHRLALADRASAAVTPRPDSSVTEYVDDDAGGSDTLFGPPDAGHPLSDDAATTLALAVEVVRADPDVSGARLADELTRRGRPVSTRSGQRWRTRALAAMTG